MNIDKLIHCPKKDGTVICFGSLMNIDKLILTFNPHNTQAGFGSLMNIDKLILTPTQSDVLISFGSLMNIKLKETACGILFCKLLFYIQRGDRGTAFFGII